MFLRSLITKVIATISQRNNMENCLQARSIFRTVILCSCLKKKIKVKDCYKKTVTKE